jgi:hypothetical protein
MDATVLALWIGAGVIVLLFLLAVLWLAVRVLRSLWRAFWGPWWSVFGDTLQARIIALGVAVFFFPVLVTGPFDGLFRFLQTLLSNTPAALGPVVGALSKNWNPQLLTQSVYSAISALANVLSNAIGSAFFPITPMILGLACWVIIGQLLSGGPGLGGSAWLRLIRGLSPVVRKDAALFAVLFLGAYLSIAAITAIPSLQKGETPIETDKNRLTQQLAASRLYSTKEEFQRAFKEPDDLKPFSSLREALGLPAAEEPSQTQAVKAAASESSNVKEPPATKDGAGTGKSPEPGGGAKAIPAKAEAIQGPPAISASLGAMAATRPDVQSMLDVIKRWLQGQENTRKELRRRFTEMRDSVFSQEELAQKKAADSFDTGTAGRMGARERSRYIRTLDQGYQNYSSFLEGQLRGCLSYLGSKDNEWQSRSSYTVQLLGDLVRSPDPYFSSMIANSVFAGSAGPELTCAFSQGTEFAIPAAPKAVDDWGVFRFFAGWLIQSDSLALASITGMLGAGLLGAAASSFIRQRGERAVGRPLVDDLAGIVIRGFSAAIVIFLAVQGGINIFASSTGEPNPYVLLCTCLVGAVFSEDVWTKARIWLKSGRAEHGKERAGHSEPPRDEQVPEPGRELVKVEQRSLEPAKAPQP